MLKKMQKKLSASFMFAVPFLENTVIAYAFKIDPNVKASDFDNYTIGDVQGIMLGTTFWILRLLGIAAVMWSFYNFITAKKQSDPKAYEVAWTKLVIGLTMIVLPVILKATNIISY